MFQHLFNANLRLSELFEAFFKELVLNHEFTGEKISPWSTMVTPWFGESKSYSTLLTDKNHRIMLKRYAETATVGTELSRIETPTALGSRPFSTQS